MKQFIGFVIYVAHLVSIMVVLIQSGVGFEWKQCPMESTIGQNKKGWRKRSEGLKRGCTGKGQKEGRTQAHFYVGISYGKGIIQTTAYSGSMSGQRYIESVAPRMEAALEKSGNPKARRILQDNCPVINSKAVMDDLHDRGILIFNIPTRSADLNPIENLFSGIRKALHKDAVSRNINKETFRQFQQRVLHVMKSYPIVKVDKLIDSMWRRLDAVINSEGDRINY